MGLSTVRQPTADRYEALLNEGRKQGLTRDAARAYATLGFWGEYYGVRAPAIHSGKRSNATQLALQAAWDRGQRSGMAVRPASSSAHTRGEGFDLPRGDHLALYGHWAPYLGIRWGGKFSTPDPVHFDLGA